MFCLDGATFKNVSSRPIENGKENLRNSIIRHMLIENLYHVVRNVA